MSFYLDTNVVISLFFPDAHSRLVENWMGSAPGAMVVSSWVETELNAFIQRNVRTGNLRQKAADQKLVAIEEFVKERVVRLGLSANAGTLAANLARDPSLKLSAADALHLALSSENGLCLVTFDIRLAEAARLRGIRVETP